MLSLSQPFYFPKFIHAGEANFKAWSDRFKKTRLYKLDWSQAENYKEDKYYKWAKERDIKAKYTGELPVKYDEWLKNITFAIPEHYMYRIKDFSQKANFGWCDKYPYDTSIRELCLKPAISYVEVAFKLIADCPYNEETNYFYRGDDRILIAHAALYKFWSFQTGRGCVEDHADFRRLEYIVKKGMAKPEFKTMVRKFLSAIKRYQKRLEKMYEGVSVESPTGPKT